MRVSGKKATDVEKAARRASARFESRRRRLSDGMGGGGFEDASVLEASDEDREGGENRWNRGERTGCCGCEYRRAKRWG